VPASADQFDACSDLSRLNAAGGHWVEVDSRVAAALRAARRARRDSGGRFDPTILPARVAKGFSAERALEAVCRSWPGLRSGFVDLDGDIAFFGAPPDASAWRIAVADPRAPGRTLLTLRLVAREWRRRARNAGTDLADVKGPVVAAIALAPVLWLGLLRILEPRRPAPPHASRSARAEPQPA
jgi:ApbE family